MRTHEAAFAADPLKPWVGYAQGILAARSRKPEALAQLTPWIDARVAQCAQSAAVWGFFGIGAGWWALALHDAGRGQEAR
ncbi:hypothetical protein ABTL14_19740, partial [Acinetobacter baumannii]